MSAFSAMTRSVMSRRFSSMSGLASWLGNVPSTSKQSVVSFFVGMCSKSSGATRPGHAAAGVEHDVERLEDRQIDERQDVLDVVVDDVLRRDACPACRGRRRQLAGGDHVADVADARTRRDSGNASCRTILMPLYSFGIVRGGDLDAAVVPVPRDGEIEHVGAHHAVVDDVGPLAGRALDERRRHRRRREPHVARHGDALRAEVGDEAAADQARRLLVDLLGIESADVVGLEDVDGLMAIIDLAVVGDDGLVAEDRRGLDGGAAADVAVAAEDRAFARSRRGRSSRSAR